MGRRQGAGEGMRVRLITSWEEPCGIAEHSAMLKEAVEAADPTIEIVPDAASIDGSFPLGPDYDILHLNYQAALHSRWTPLRLQQYRNVARKPIVVTYHDTGIPNSDQCKAIIDAADAAVVHESFDDLPAGKTRYWRMGVPPAPINPLRLHVSRREIDRHRWYGVRSYPDQPVLGSIGFSFGWKNYKELARLTRAAGWALLLIAPRATADEIAEWTAYNPDCLVYADFLDRRRVIRLLHGCDATAFTYVCHNTGQSGALLMGVAARKPVIALSTCRQFRARYEDELGHEAIFWCRTFAEGARAQRTTPIAR